jgi:hypothetical protein
MQIRNFGRNVSFSPKAFYRPSTEREVLEILDRHKAGQVRVSGATHAWNAGIASHDAFVNLMNLEGIKIVNENGKNYAVVAGGTKLEKVIRYITDHNFMIPAMGGIMQQSVAGLASTSTHGTGNSSFSHFLAEIRIAAYDENGNAKIFTYSDGDELRAARTAVGVMGVIVSVKIPLIPRYFLTEISTTAQTLDEALAQEAEWPLQQFAAIPHAWTFLMFKRKVVPTLGSKLRATMMRFRDVISIEFLPHALLKMVLWFRSDKLVVDYYKFLPKLLFDVTTTNEDYKGLTLHTRRHYRFRHVEMEIFVPEPHIRETYKTIREIVDWFAGTSHELSLELKHKLSQAGLLEKVLQVHGKYTLHYTIFFRKVFPDDSMIGLTAGHQNYYAMGFFTYHKESKRAGYYLFTETMAHVLNKFYHARLHWGKHFPLTHQDVGHLYPEMEKFKSVCKKTDPHGVFQNDFTKKIFG